MMILSTYIQSNKKYIEEILKTYIPVNEGYEQVVYDAMGYSLMAGGKRLRPMILLEVYKLFAQDLRPIKGFIAAVEMIHTYSLIHDDLPAMDNDVLRRGLPTCHIKYGEDMAILAGDGLLTMAFEVMIEAILEFDLGRPGILAMSCLGEKSGTRGMVGGQVVDIINEGKSIDIETVNYIHSHKTAALIEASFMMGGYLGGASDEVAKTLEQIGHNVGMAFQIQDDLLDVLSTEEELGKPINSDHKNAKQTYIDLKGVEGSQKEIHSYLDKSDALVETLPVENTTFISSLIEFIRTRDN